ncbi:hypothetical protein [Nibricoccus sp. IMCC34717]|uniref:hypothetical protein n=1 Tax=Nibricoccus sp. IMCC34717 TaxID=3034021 RepID=UPI00384E415E
MKKLLWKFALRFLAPAGDRMILESVKRPYRWIPDPTFDRGEIADWRRLLGTSFGLKIDTAMVNWCQQRAQMAVQAPAGEIEKMAGFALGARVAWETAKSISRMDEAHSSSSEPEASTVAEGLEHIRP